MSQPKRYDVISPNSIKESWYGDYIRYADYADLKAEVKRLTKLNKKIMATADIIDASNQRLIKAGDALAELVEPPYEIMKQDDYPVWAAEIDLMKRWNAAKNLNS